MTSSLALERRSQPAQILQLQREYAELTQRFALDSQTLHSQLLEHDAALVHFRETLDSTSQELWAQIVVLQSRLRTLETPEAPTTFWQRVRWMVTGR